jgi:protein-S-isoprenylcysteine O-methyltransferase Ste14
MMRIREEPIEGARWDDLVLSTLLIVLGGFRVVLAVTEHERWGAESTLAAVTTFIGLLLLLSAIRRRR